MSPHEAGNEAPQGAASVAGPWQALGVDREVAVFTKGALDVAMAETSAASGWVGCEWTHIFSQPRGEWGVA